MQFKAPGLGILDESATVLRTTMAANADRSILFIAAHPFLEKSRANRAVVEAVGGLPGLTLRRLYHLYPQFHVDVAAEQELLIRHSLIVVQHPFYWYSMPPLLKMWLDETFESGWAYGSGGDRLRGKEFLLSLTVGGPEESYMEDGYNRFTIDTFLAPWKQTAHLCQMHWNQPRIVHSSIKCGDAVLVEHARKLRGGLERYLSEGILP